MSKEIIIGSFGGLCNKIKNIISGMILSEHSQLPLKIIWPKNKWIRVNYEDLFESPKLDFLETDLVDDILSIKNPYRSSIYINNINYDFKFNTIPINIKDQIKKICDLIKPNKHLYEKIEFYTEKFDIYNNVGIHYRYDPEWITIHQKIKENLKLDEYMYYKNFINKISDYPESTPFFMSSARNEEYIILNNMKKTCNTINFIEKNNSQTASVNRNLKIMNESVIDLFLLSRCKELIITPRSTFNEISWMIGGCNKPVFNPLTYKYV